ncbi:HmuY family protein [Aquimarina hainanensis]|uniref:HmuY family protein n=1 Tax=Aquimarina hainanensis TaxID=1578017 RepID=A0ABW5N1I1_9FLAO
MKLIKKITFVLFYGITLLLFQACSDDETLTPDPFVVAFKNLSSNLSEIPNQTEIKLVYSEVAEENGSFTISIDAKNARYGIDFTTVPEAVNNQIKLPITIGEAASKIVFKKLSPYMDETTDIKLNITNISYNGSNIQGNIEYALGTSPSLGGNIQVNVGGPNQPNQAFIDLSSGIATTPRRDSWDLGFYGGAHFRVTINGALYMATKALDTDDIDSVNEASVIAIQPEVAVGTFRADNIAYIDAPNGNILETAIAEISVTPSENKVYLLNLGSEVSTETPKPGSVSISGGKRGWKKIRITREGNEYILQYANLNDTTHQQIRISKNAAYNFTFFSFEKNAVVPVEPEASKWDVGFTVFTNAITGYGSYGFSDFIIHNRKGSVTAYRVNTEDIPYEDFTLTSVEDTLFSEDQTAIGSSWRSVFKKVAHSDRYYILKDANGNIYKIRFTALTNSDGLRGYPEFEYKLLQ